MNAQVLVVSVALVVALATLAALTFLSLRGVETSRRFSKTCSVAVVEWLAEAFRAEGVSVFVEHRDLENEKIGIKYQPID